MDISEEKWLADLAGKKHYAYQILFKRYYSSLCIFAVKLINDREVAQDFVQDLLYDLYQSDTIFSSQITLRAYLYNAIRNKSLNHLRQTLRIEQFSANQQYYEEEFVTAIIEEENYQLLYNAIDSLSDIAQQIFRQTLTGASNQEIALQMNLTLDSVKAHKKRGKQQLLQLLSNYKELYSVISIVI